METIIDRNSTCGHYQVHHSLKGADSPEGRLVCTVLLTLIQDMNYFNMLELRRLGLAKRKSKRVYKRRSGTAYELEQNARLTKLWKTEKQTLVTMARSLWIRRLCNLIEFDHKALVNRLKQMSAQRLVVKIYEDGVAPLERYNLEEVF
jgi:hypothetical protein